MRVSPSIWLLLLLPAVTWAEQPLHPFQVTYKTNLGLLNATGERSLSLGQDGNWLFQSSASVFGMAVTEHVAVTLRNNRIQPLSYDFVNPLSSKRNLSLRFDWAQHKLTDTLRGQTRDLPEGTFDRLGFQLQLQRDVCQEGAPFRVQDYVLADANKFKTYRIEYLGRESLNTKVGKLDTVKLRQYRPGKTGDSLIWLAPAWDCLLVQLEDRDEDDSQVLKLVKATVAGREVTGVR